MSAIRSATLVARLTLVVGPTAVLQEGVSAPSDENVRVYLSAERVPLRDLLGALARQDGLTLDLGGREVKGELEVASNDQGISLSLLRS